MIDLKSTIIGEGQPLIILHGFLGMSDNWKTLGGKICRARISGSSLRSKKPR